MKILILGGGGMLGHKMYQTLSRFHEEVYVSFRKDITYYRHFHIFNPNYCIDKLDVSDRFALMGALDELKPDVIVNCVGLTTRKINPVRSENVIYLNSILPHQLKRWCISNESRLFHFSTDCVFSGKEGHYTEDSVTDAMDLYGRSKAMGEVDGKGILTIRSSIVGRELENKTELMEWFISQKGQEARGFTDVKYSGLTTNYMSSLVAQLISDFPHIFGIYQVSSPSITKYDLLKMINEKMNLNINLSEDDSYKSDKTLISKRFFKETGIKQPTWEEMIDEIVKDDQFYQMGRAA